MSVLVTSKSQSSVRETVPQKIKSLHKNSQSPLFHIMSIFYVIFNIFMSC